MITLKGTKPTDRVLELGGGDNPQVRPNCDVRPGPNVDIVADFNNPLPFQTSEWDAVFSQYAIEHISYPRVIPFLQEVHRILKPGGKFICVMPNTQAQLQWIADHPEGWDNKGPFEAASELLFGSQDYVENSHKAYFSPGIIHLLFTCAGFEHIQIHAYNDRKTDMCVVGVRPQVGQVQLIQTPDKPAVPDSQMMAEMEKQMLSHTAIENYTREELYDKHYWTGGGKVGGYAREGYRDFPTHHLTAQHVLARKPTSVLEIGCLVAGSPIITDRGVLPIELVDDGMQVYTHEGQLSKVSRMSTRPYNGEIVVIEPRYSRGFPLKLTPDHPVFAIRVERQFKSWKPDLIGRPEWVPASELGVDTHWLVYPKPKQKETLKVDSDYARLCGYYLSQGWCQKKWNGSSTGYVVSFCFNEKHRDYAEDVRDLMKRYFGTTDGWIEDGTGKAFKISFYSKSGFFQLSGTFGRGARNKTIPMEWVVGASSEVLKQLVLGMYRGDGAKTSDRFDYCTASVSMAVSLRMVMMRLGIFTELASQEGKDSEIDGRVITATRSYRVRAAGSQAVAAGTIVGIQFRTSSDGRSYWFGREDSDFFYVPIKRLVREEFDGVVFNMDVEEDHSYSHPVCTVHNCARGYILKRLQDAGVPRSAGLEISRHCYMTRVASPILKQDVCQTPWDIGLISTKFDLAFSIAVFEHIPESLLSGVLYELARTSNRGLHGIDFGQNDDGFDKTHVNLKSKSWWRETFDRHGLQSHEIVDKEELERWSSDVTPQWYEDTIIKGDGKLKLNVGCGMTMYHYGWHNIDVQDYNPLAQHERYLFRQHDVKNGLPYDTNSVDYMHISHLLEHLTYEEGMKFLRECRRVIKPGGVIRFACVDAELPTHLYSTIGDGADGTKLSDFDEISDACERARSNAGKLHALLWDGRQAIYDWDSLRKALQEAGFSAVHKQFREGTAQILKETLDMVPALSFFAEATPSET